MLSVRILGCGSSGGVPRVGGDWGACDPSDPRNRRTRCSILVEKRADADAEPTRLLVDTSPDLREQMLAAEVKRLDALIYTHDHADQSHGIDDIRAISYMMRQQVPTFMDAPTRDALVTRFGYCFEMPEGRVHPPILDLQPVVTPGDVLTIDGPGGSVSVKTVPLSHGPTPVLGLIFDQTMAYTPDVHDIPEDSMPYFDDLELWVCDALRYHDHPTHAHADRTLSWQARTRTRRMVLTNLHIDMDYDTLSTELPGAQSAAVDGLVVRSTG